MTPEQCRNVEIIARYMGSKPIDQYPAKVHDTLWFTPRYYPHTNYRLHFEVLKGYYSNNHFELTILWREIQKDLRENPSLLLITLSKVSKTHAEIDELIRTDLFAAVDHITSWIIVMKANKCSCCDKTSDTTNFSAFCRKCDNVFCSEHRWQTCFCQQYLK